MMAFSVLNDCSIIFSAISNAILESFPNTASKLVIDLDLDGRFDPVKIPDLAITGRAQNTASTTLEARVNLAACGTVPSGKALTSLHE